MSSSANSPSVPTWSGPFNDVDDKYAKCSKPNTKYQEAWMLMEGCISERQVRLMLRDSFCLYALFLMGGSFLYHHLGGSFADASAEDALGYASAIAEACGLLVLRRKIQRQGSVAGISGMTMVMYAVVYFLRQVLLLPPFDLRYLDMWAVQSLSLTSLLMVIDILRSVFVTYRSTYQEEWDVLHVQHLIPACVCLAGLLHPCFQEGTWYSFCWTACLYLDVLALMPQVVMMGRAGGKVSAPISHFVAATAMSRVVDLSFWLKNFDRVGEYESGEVHFSGCLIIFFHVVHLLLVADFMYYYLKARLVNANFSEDLSLPVEVVEV